MADHRLQIVLAAKDTTRGAFKKLQGRVKALASGMFSLRGAAVALGAATGFGYVVKGALASADAIGKAADVIGIHTAALQEYRHAASLSGVETGLLDKSFAAFTKRVGEARAGTGPLVTYLKKVDEQLLANIISAGSSEKALDLVFRRMASLTNAADRAALANAAFSRSGLKLVNMVKGGADGLDAMRSEAHRLGLVLNDDLIRNAEKANDELDKLSRVVKTNLTKTLISLAPKIIDASESMLAWVENNQKMIEQDIPAFFSDTAEEISNIVDSVKTLITFKDDVADFFGAFADVATLEGRIKKALELYDRITGQSKPRTKFFGVSGSWAEDEDVKKTGAEDTTAPAITSEIEKTLRLQNELAARSVMQQKELAEQSLSDYIKISNQEIEIEKAKLRRIDEMGAEAVMQGKELAEQSLRDYIETSNREIEIAQELAEKSASGMRTAFESASYFMSHALATFVTDGKLSFKGFADSVLSDLVRMQSQMLIMGLLKKVTGAFSGGTAAVDTSYWHAGGVVGADTAPRRSVPAAMFIGAPRLHGGLARDEFPAILQKGETVIPKGAGAGGAVTVNVINKTSRPAKGRETGRRFDGRQWVVDVVLEDIATNGPLRRVWQGA